MANRIFANFTDLDNKDASKLLVKLRDIVLNGESNRQKRVKKAKRNNDFWLNKIWSDADEEFFKELDITPYQLPVQRPLVNNLISRQRQRKVSFDVVPTDLHSYKRHSNGREKYVADNLDRHSSIEEAKEYYDKYSDDQYAQAVSTLLHNTRIECKAKHTESNSFQQGLITGLDFFKAIYSKKYNKTGGIEIARRSQRAVFYDETSTEYDLSDIEYIGEVHLMYKSQIIAEFPERKDEIEKLFKEYTNLDNRDFTTTQRDWEYFYNFEFSEGSGEGKARIAEVWFLDTEERWVIVDTQSGEKRLVNHGLDEQEVIDKLLAKELSEITMNARKGDPEAKKILESENPKLKVAEIVDQKYDLETTYKTVWYKAVFSYNALLELQRSPLPHNSHPYFPFFAQFTEGDFTSLMSDIEDVIIAINKALAVRELMMAHGSKNLLVIDDTALAQSDYDIDDIADQWTRIGGILAIKPKPGQSVKDIVASITTVGEGLPAITAVLQDLDQRLFHISGVNLAQLGITQRETTSSGFRQQVVEGQTNNGLIFDNFLRSTESFYNDKVVPLIVHMMKTKKQKVIRSLSDEFKPWIEIDFDDDFDLFADAIMNGQYNTALRPKDEDAQIGEQRAAKYMELALASPDQFPIEVAIEFSNDPDRYKIIKRIKEVQLEQARRMAATQVDIQMVQQIALESGLSPEAVEDLIKELQLQKLKETNQTNTGAAVQNAQGAPTVREDANQTKRQQNLEQTINEAQGG